MVERLKPIKKDELIVFSSGEYSDYNLCGLGKAVKDIDVSTIRDEYLSFYPEQMGKYAFNEDQFIDFLKHNEYIEIVACKEWYLDSYSTISNMRVDDGPMLFT